MSLKSILCLSNNSEVNIACDIRLLKQGYNHLSYQHDGKIEEDSPMDAYTAIAITQTVLDWTLFGVLLAWMVTFAVLALHANPTSTINAEELPTPAYSFPVTTAPTSLHVVATQPAAFPVGKRSHDTSGEMDTVTMA